MYTSLSVCHVYMYVCVSVCPSVNPGHLSALLSGCTFVWLSVRPFVWMDVCLSICVSDCLICLFVRPSICVCPSVRPSHTHNQAFRQVGKQTVIYRDRQTYRWTYIRTDGYTYIYISTEERARACVRAHITKYIHTCRQSDRQTDRQEGTSHFLVPTYYFLVPASYFFVPTS